MKLFAKVNVPFQDKNNILIKLKQKDMGLFNFKKKQQQPILETIQEKVFDNEEILSEYPEEFKKEIPEEYPEIVKEIHNMFYSAADRLVEEAEEYKKSAQSRDVKKGVSLSSLGFSQAQQVEEAIETNKKHSLTSEQLNFFRKI